MPTAASIVTELKKKGTEKGRAMYAKHGMPGDHVLGVSIADLKAVAKEIKGQQTLAYELFDSGFMEAMYLAGIIADGSQMTKKQLDSWASGAARLPMIAENTVPWVAVESPLAYELAKKWMGSKEDLVASAGWTTYSGMLSTKADSELDFAEIRGLMAQIVKHIWKAKDRTRYAMNSFLIAVRVYVRPLVNDAVAAANAIGVVTVDMGDTSCKVPSAVDYIKKTEAAGRAGKKRKTLKC